MKYDQRSMTNEIPKRGKENFMKQLILDPVQVGGVEFLKTHKRAMITLGVGVGKSAILLNYLAGAAFSRAMVIVPKSVFARWKAAVAEQLGGRLVNVITFGAIESHAKLIADAEIVAVDEPKLLKNRFNRVHKQLVSIAEVSPHWQQRILLDATPVECHVGDELSAITAWLGLDNTTDLTGCLYPLGESESPRPRVVRRIRIHIPSNRKPMERYLEMELINRLLPRVKSARMANAAIGHLLSGLNGFAKGELGPHKLEVLVEIIQTKHKEDAGVICVIHKDAMNAIATRLNEVGLKAATFSGEMSAKQRQRIVDTFASGGVDWVVCTKAGERGLDLSRGTAVFHVELPWAGSSFTQRDRVTRRSGDLSKTTKVYVLMFDGSVEELVYQRVKNRIKMNKDLCEGGSAKEVFGQSWSNFLIAKWQRLYGLDVSKGIV